MQSVFCIQLNCIPPKPQGPVTYCNMRQRHTHLIRRMNLLSLYMYMISAKSMDKNILDEFRHRIPFLKQIPDEIYYGLDTREFHLPSGKIARIREQLEQELGHYVMTYKSTTFFPNTDPNKHLCVNLKKAALDRKQTEILNKYEKITSQYGVSLAIYKNPIELIKPIQEAVELGLPYIQ